MEIRAACAGGRSAERDCDRVQDRAPAVQRDRSGVTFWNTDAKLTTGDEMRDRDHRCARHRLSARGDASRSKTSTSIGDTAGSESSRKAPRKPTPHASSRLRQATRLEKVCAAWVSRARCCTCSARRRVPIHELQLLAGHASITTTTALHERARELAGGVDAPGARHGGSRRLEQSR